MKKGEPLIISMSVTEFAVPSPRVGSIDAYSGLGRAQQIGIELHQRVQEARRAAYPDYRSEVEIRHGFEREGFRFEMGGRIDGVFDGEVRFEEIKSTFNLFELQRVLADSDGMHPYCLQVRTYGYFHWLKTGQIPELSLHLVSSRKSESRDFDVRLDLTQYEAWLDRRLDELTALAHAVQVRAKRRRKTAHKLEFPFDSPRPGQVDLIATIEEAMRERQFLLAQAPTGLGKTIGVLYPALRDALVRGQQVIYVTPKNSQHSVAEDAIDRLQERGASLKGMTLTSKSKMCFKEEPLCNPEYCEYAKDHYTKVAKNDLRTVLSKKRRLSARTFKSIAQEHEVCPYELQLEAVPEADVVICDYHYAFAPRSALGRVADLRMEQIGLPNLVIDEAHNLPSRAADDYSPALSARTLELMRPEIEKLPGRFRTHARELLDECIAVIASAAPEGCDRSMKISPPSAEFDAQDGRLREFLTSYLNSDAEIRANDVVLRLCHYWSEFTGALEFVTEDREEFFTTYAPHPPTIRITCCDASSLLRERYSAFENVIGFSATLKPFRYYSELMGLDGPRLRTEEFSSPFSKEHRKLLVIPQVSSKYAVRERNYPKIADAISRIAALKRGNYFCFFPSFEFMNRVAALCLPPEGFTILQQTRGMTRDAVNACIDRLREPGGASLIFAVQGGVFSEGMDYPGDMVIGAFVVGPPLPTFDLERETVRSFFQKRNSAGFDYAYTFPAMAKAVQAAGRVIRTETDRGLIVLMDERFLQPGYAQSMPSDWFETTPQELVSKSILNDIARFWDGIPSVRNESEDRMFLEDP